MKKAIIKGFGKTDQLDFIEVAVPSINNQEVLVKVVAASVNPKDTFIRKGRYKALTGSRFPMGVGFDYAGVVEQSNIAEFQKGDAVFGMVNGWVGKTFAQFVAVGKNEICSAPKNVDLTRAASIPLVAQTALQALRDIGKIKEGYHICINGASGGVGTMAIQIAKSFGAKVTTLTSPANFELCSSLGADNTLNYAEKMSVAAFDIYFDVFGNQSFSSVKNLLSKKGIYISTVPSKKLLWRQFFINPFFSQKAALVIVQSTIKKLEWIKTNIEMGTLIPTIDSIFPFSELSKAQSKVETKRTKGKVVVLIN
ncbi:MAG: NAD(P)-dependent alcohol dehydrogenase [Sphingobacteriia bacterium]